MREELGYGPTRVFKGRRHGPEDAACNGTRTISGEPLKRFVFAFVTALVFSTALFAAEAAPPEIHEINNRILRVTFPPGADQVCVYLQRQVQQEPDSSTNADGYYTPSSCTPLEDNSTLQELDDNIWNMVMPWFEHRHEEEATWLVWAEISYPAVDGADTVIPTAVSSVVR